MPIYEYRCENCKENFSLKMSMSRHHDETVVCPSCRGAGVVPQLASFFAKTSKKS